MTRLETPRGALSNGKTKWFAPRFSLRLLLIVVLACGLVLGWIGSRVGRHRKDVAYAARLEKVGSIRTVNDVPEWIQDLVSYEWIEAFEQVRHIELVPDKATYDEKVLRSKSIFPNYSLKEIACLPKLKTIDLNGTRIDDDGLLELKNVKTLEQICIHGTAITEAGKAQLNLHLPRVIFSIVRVRSS